MDENAYKQTYNAVNRIVCPFENAILTGRFVCEKSAQIHLAERVAVSCSTEDIREDCAELLGLLHHNAMFALKLTHVDEVLPHSKEMKVQCGGLLGLQAALRPDLAAATGVENIFALVEAAQERFGSLDALPFQEIVKAVSAFQIRRR